MPYKKICVVGLGHIGLPSAALFASKKKNVIGVDINQSVVKKLNKGKIHISEPGLMTLVSKVIKNGFLKVSSKIDVADVFIIAVPTPFKLGKNGTNPKPDCRFIFDAVLSISKVIKKGDLIILESTVPVGTTEEISKILKKCRGDLNFPHEITEFPDINIAYCPERVLPGNILKELILNDRVLGGLTKKCSSKAKTFYKNFIKGKCVVTDAKTAEMVKLTENASRDLQIGFANELSIICDELNINVWHLIELANKHPRVNILNPGPGVGGHCIAVDPWFIVDKNPRNSKLIKTSREVNDSKPNWVIKKIKKELKIYMVNNPKKKLPKIKVAFYGLSFKPNVSDLRQSPSIEILKKVINFFSGQILVVEPNIKKLPFTKPNLKISKYEDAIKKADIHILLVAHKEFLKKPNKGLIIDLQGNWSK